MKDNSKCRLDLEIFDPSKIANIVEVVFTNFSSLYTFSHFILSLLNFLFFQYGSLAFETLLFEIVE